MPSNIDDRIVNMKFNNKGFESGVADTMKTLEKFQTKLQKLDGGKAFDELEKAANKLDLSNIGRGLDTVSGAVSTVSNQFSSWGIAAKRVIENITDDAYRLGKQFVTSLSIDQVKAGWEKYGSMAQSVGTIMSATGLTIDEVTEQMDKLNWYTDETSYNYTDMADNIAKFTSQEIPLERATEAMMGIANWAALAGQNASTASRAMYNVSQAMGIGYMGLADWKSIELANMGTAQFKQHVIDVAVEMGKLYEVTTETGNKIVALSEDATKDEDAITVANFRESLKEKWFDVDVMERVFQDYGKFATKLNETINELNEADNTLQINATDLLGILDEYSKNKSLGQLNERLKGTSTSAQDVIKYLDILSSDTYSLSREAFAAAQEYRTFADAIDATKDAVSTQWMNTYANIFGNYEEAKELWTSFGTTLYDLFATSGEERNAVLREWKALGGRDTLVTAITEALETLDNVVFAIKDGFERIFPAIDTDKLLEITDAIANFIDSIYINEEDYETLDKIAEIVEHLAGSAESAFSTLGSFFKEFSASFNGTFLDNVNLDTLNEFAEAIEDFVSSFEPSEEQLGKFRDAVDGVFKIVKRVLPFFESAGETAVTILVKIGDALGKIATEAIIFATDKIDAVLDWFQRFKDNEALSESLGRLHDAFKRLFDVIKKNASKVSDKVAAFFESLNLSEKSTELFNKLADAIADLIIVVSDFVSGGVEKLAEFLENTDIIEKAIDAWNGFSDAIENAYNKVVDFLAPAIDIVSESLEKAYTSAKEYLPQAFEWLSEHLEDAYNATTTFLQPAAERIKDFFANFKDAAGSVSLSSITVGFKDIGGGVWEKLEAFFNKVKDEWIPVILDFVKKKYPEVAKLFANVKDWVIDFWKSDDKLEKIKTTIIDVSSAISDFAKNAFEKLKSAWKWVKEQLDDLGPAGIILAAFAGGLIAILVSLLNILDKLTGPVAGVLGAVEGFLNSGKGLLRAAKINQIAAALNTLATATKTLSTAFLILAVSLKVIDSLDNAWGAVAVLGAMAAGIMVLLAAFRFLGTAKDKDNNIKAINFFGDAAKLLIGVSISMLAFVAVAKKIGAMNKDEWWTGFLRTFAVLGAMILAVRAATPKDGTRSAIKGALSILALTLGVDLLVKSLANMRSIDIADAIAKTILLTAVAVALGHLANAFTKHKVSSGKYEHEDKISILGAAAVMLAFVLAMRELTKVKMKDIDILGVLVSVGVMIGSVAAVLAIVNKFTKDNKNSKDAEKQIAYVGAGVLALAVAAAVMGAAMTKIKIKDPKSFMIMAAVYVALIGAMALLIKASHVSKAETSGGPGAALEIAALAGALTILAVTIGLLSLVDWKKLVAPTMMIISLIGMLAILMKASAGLSKDSFKAILSAGILVALIAAVVGVITAIGAEKFVPATKIVGAIVVFLGALMYMLSKVPKNILGPVDSFLLGLVSLIATAGAVLAAAWIITQAIDVIKDAGITNSDLISFTAITALLLGIAVAIGYMAKSMKGNSIGILDILKTMTPIIAAIILLFAIATVIGAVADSLKGIDVSNQSLLSIAAMALLVGLIAVALTKMAKDLSTSKVSLKDLGVVAGIILFSAGMIYLITLITNYIATSLDSVKIPSKEALTAIGAVALITGLVAILLGATAKILKNANLGYRQVFASLEVIGGAVLVLAMIVGVTKIISSLLTGYIPPKTMLKQIGSIALVAGLVMAIAAVSTLLTKGISLLKIKSADVGKMLAMLGIAAGLFVVSAGIIGLIYDSLITANIDISNFTSKILAIGEVMLAIGLGAAMLAVLSKLPVSSSDITRIGGSLIAGASLLLISSAIVSLIETVLLTKNIDIGGFTNKILAIGEVMLAIVLAAVAVAGISKFSVNPSSLISSLEALGAGAIVFIGAAVIAGILNSVMKDHPIEIGQFTSTMRAVGEVILAVSAATALVLGLGYLAGGNPATAATLALSGFTAVAIILVGVGLLALCIGGVIEACGGSADKAEETLRKGFQILNVVVEGIGGLFAAFFKAAIGDTIGLIIERVGESLGNFWEDAGPFLEAIKADGESIGSALSAFAGGLKSFTAAEVLDGLATMFGLKNPEGIKTSFSAMGEGIKSFQDGIGDANLSRVKMGAAALTEICNAMKEVPKEGGLWGILVGAITGKKDFSGYAEGMEQLGKGLGMFYAKTRYIDQDKLSAAAAAITLLAPLNDLVPKSGGLLQRIFGETGLGKFGDSLPALGEGLAGFVTAIKDSTYENVKTAVDSLKIIAGLNDLVPRSDGFLQRAFGEKDLQNFGDSLPALGTGLYKFSSSIASAYGNLGSRGSTIVDTAIGWIDKFVSFFNSLDATGGAWHDWIAGNQSFEPLADSMGLLGHGFADFANELKSVDSDVFDKAIEYGNKIVTMTARVALADLTGFVNEFNDAILTFTGRLINYVNSVSAFTDEDLDRAIEFVGKFMALADNADFSGILSFSTAFSSLAEVSIELFIAKFEDAWDDVKDAGNKFMQKCYDGMRFALTDPNIGISLVGEDAAKAFIDAIDAKAGANISVENSAMRAGWRLAKAARDGINKGMSNSEAKRVGESIGQGLIDGLSAKEGPVNDKAFEIGLDIIKQLRFATRTMSPSREAMSVGQFIDLGLAKGMDLYTSVVENSAENIGDNAIDAMKNSIARVNDVINSDMNLDPTIRPVLDLSGLQNGSSAAARLLNIGPMAVSADQFALTSEMAGELAASDGTQNGTINGGLIASILEHIDMLSNDIQQMQLVMDSGAVVGSIAGQMDNALGRMASYRGRGN